MTAENRSSPSASPDQPPRGRGEAPPEPAAVRGRYLAVDRVEGDVAVLIGDEGDAHDVPAARLPVRPREGMVLRVADGPDGRPDWSTAAADDAERERRLRDLRGRAARLARSDPGGDLAL